jgi:uncharacterized protein (DUF58 family)
MEAQRTRDVLKAVRNAELKVRRIVDGRFASRYRTAFRGRGMDGGDVRTYVRGDEARAIDWNVTARTGVPHVRVGREERGQTVLLVVDVSTSGYYGTKHAAKRELAAEAAGVLALSALRSGDRVGLLLFTDRVELYLPPKAGRSHMLRILREILFLAPKGRGTELGLALDQATYLLGQRAITFLISDFLLPGGSTWHLASLARRLRAVGRRHDLVAVTVSDPRELELPDMGVVALEDAETGEKIEIDTSRAATRESYRRAAERYQEMITWCIRLGGIDRIELSTARPCLPAFLGFFDRRWKRLAM